MAAQLRRSRRTGFGWLDFELLERLLEGEIKSAFCRQRGAGNEILGTLGQRHQALPKPRHRNRPGLNDDEIRLYDALADNESAVCELSDETLKKIVHELPENLRQNITVDWSQRESIRAKLRLMMKRILRKYNYPPDRQESAIELVLQQAQALGCGLFDLSRLVGFGCGGPEGCKVRSQYYPKPR